jgi:hypothetical protein
MSIPPIPTPTPSPGGTPTPREQETARQKALTSAVGPGVTPLNEGIGLYGNQLVPMGQPAGGNVSTELDPGWAALAETWGVDPQALYGLYQQTGDLETAIAMLRGPTATGGGTGATWRSGEYEIALRQQEVAEGQLEIQRRTQKMNELANSLEQQISVGEMDRQTALTRFQAQVDALMAAPTAIANLAPISVPAGTEYIPGFEPQGVASNLAQMVGVPWAGQRTETVSVNPYEASQFAQTAALPSSGSLGDAIKQAWESFGV